MTKEELCARYEMALRAIITLGYSGPSAIARSAITVTETTK